MDIAARTRAVGKDTGRMEGRKKICKVKCQGCGKYISSDGDLSEVEYVKTKRGSEWFFHRKCMGNVWNHGIV